jgi:hypothetical protein
MQVTQALLRLSIHRDLENLSLPPEKQSHTTANLEQIAQQVQAQSCEAGTNGALGLAAPSGTSLTKEEVLQSIERLMEMQLVFEDPQGGFGFDQFPAMHAVSSQATDAYSVTCVVCSLYLTY